MWTQHDDPVGWDDTGVVAAQVMLFFSQLRYVPPIMPPSMRDTYEVQQCPAPIPWLVAE